MQFWKTDACKADSKSTGAHRRISAHQLNQLLTHTKKHISVDIYFIGVRFKRKLIWVTAALSFFDPPTLLGATHDHLWLFSITSVSHKKLLQSRYVSVSGAISLSSLLYNTFFFCVRREIEEEEEAKPPPPPPQHTMHTCQYTLGGMCRCAALHRRVDAL